MEFSRKGDKAYCESSHEYVDETVYIRKIIDIYSASDIKKKFWLTDREKDFFVSTIVHINLGIDNPISEAAVQIYKKYFNFKISKKVINQYITLIANKKWLKYDKEGRQVKMPGIFYDIKTEHDSFEFKLVVSNNNALHRPDNDGDTG